MLKSTTFQLSNTECHTKSERWVAQGERRSERQKLKIPSGSTANTPIKALNRLNAKIKCDIIPISTWRLVWGRMNEIHSQRIAISYLYVCAICCFPYFHISYILMPHAVCSVPRYCITIHFLRPHLSWLSTQNKNDGNYVDDDYDDDA